MRNISDLSNSPQVPPALTRARVRRKRTAVLVGLAVTAFAVVVAAPLTERLPLETSPEAGGSPALETAERAVSGGQAGEESSSGETVSGGIAPVLAGPWHERYSLTQPSDGDVQARAFRDDGLSRSDGNLASCPATTVESGDALASEDSGCGGLRYKTEWKFHPGEEGVVPAHRVPALPGYEGVDAWVSSGAYDVSKRQACGPSENQQLLGSVQHSTYAVHFLACFDEDDAQQSDAQIYMQPDPYDCEWFWRYESCYSGRNTLVNIYYTQDGFTPDRQGAWRQEGDHLAVAGQRLFGDDAGRYVLTGDPDRPYESPLLEPES